MSTSTHLTRNKSTIKHWIQLTKPGIIMGNLLTAFGGFMMLRPQHLWGFTLMALLAGLGLIIGSACTFNNIIDKDLDRLMARTQKRPLAQNVISTAAAVSLGIALFLIGSWILYAGTNTPTMLLAICGWALYVGVYSFMKYETSFATWMGSLAGAVPPVAGYCAATASCDAIAAILFSIVACWQMPHFLAIGMYRIEDYSNGNIPILPRIGNLMITKVHMLCYLVGFVVACWMLYRVAHLSSAFLYVMGGVSALWIKVGVEGFFVIDEQKWAKKMFLFSLIAITTFSLILPFCNGN